MDCELWSGRGLYADVSGLLHERLNDLGWAMLRLIVFDNADPTVNHLPFEERYKSLLAAGVDVTFPLIVASRMVVASEQLAGRMVNEITTSGGEGIILRRPLSLYEHGRSNSLVKRKKRREDTEALVVGIEPDCCQVRLPSGCEVSAQYAADLNQDQSQDLVLHLRTGDVVTIAFDSSTHHGVPVDPTVARIRKDLSWEDVAQDVRSPPVCSGLNLPPLADRTCQENKTGYWTIISNRRGYFDELASTLRFDPLEAENWYSLPPSVVQTLKNHQILHYYNDNYITALIHLYPNIGLTKDKFDAWKYWIHEGNRSLFFRHEVLASVEHVVDSSITENWQALEHIKKLPMFDFYKDTLLDFIADQRIQEGQAASQGSRSLSCQQEFFDEFAKRHSFDPLQPENWYNVSRSAILLAKGGHSALAHQQGSYVKALMCVYPAIGLEERKFKHLAKNHWKNINNRRNFFVNFSRVKGFDPLVPTNWYSCSYWELCNSKQATSVLSHYKGSVGDALLHVFPGIGLDPVRVASRLDFAHAADTIPATLPVYQDISNCPAPTTSPC